jgi:hypothetical protein
MKRNTQKKPSSKIDKYGKSKKTADMHHPPKRGGSIMKIEPEDIEEFKQRKKVANQKIAADKRERDYEYIDDDLDIENSLGPEMQDDEEDI